jgi:uncharacterized Zn finger protein
MADILSKQAVAIAANKADAELLPDNGQWTNRIQVKSESSTRLYIVAQRLSDGSWGCSCPGWKSHRNCKHLSAMTPLLVEVVRPAQPVSQPTRRR